MTPFRQKQLREAIALIDRRRTAGARADLIVRELADRFDGRSRFSFLACAYELRVAGVGATSSAGQDGLIHNWRVAALRCLEDAHA